jgi:16S rRNA processing protein RimM
VSSASSRVCLGVIVGVKGLRGEVRIKSFTERPADVAAYGPVTTEDGRSFELTVTGAAQGAVTGRLKGVADCNAAEALKGVKLYVDRKALPATDDGTYYHADLVGLAAERAGGERLGKVTAVYNFGAGDMIEVTMADGRTELVPFTEAAVAKVDMAGGKVMINPLPGLFENDSEADERERRQEQEEDDT